MEQYDNISDEELIARLRKGENGIADYLLEKYKGLVRQKARAMYLIGGDTDDLSQEGMIGLFKAVRDYQPDREASFVTFARMCIDRQLYSAVQNSNRQKHIPLNYYVSLSQEDEEEPVMDQWVANPESIIIGKESARDLQDKICGSLSPMENKVLEYFLSGRTYAQIGEAMGKSPKSIDNALKRIRVKVREALDKYGK